MNTFTSHNISANIRKNWGNYQYNFWNKKREKYYINFYYKL